MIIKKSESDLKNFRKTGKIAAQVLTLLLEKAKPGISTYEIAKYAEDLIVNKFDAIPSSIGQYNFQYALNSSVNSVVCHGVPSTDEILKEGDIINLDVTVKKHGFIADTSRMYLIGNVSPEAKRLCEVTYECLFHGIQQVAPGNTLGDIGFHIHRHAIRNGYSVVKEYCGHGIGQEMHEEPAVLHYGKKRKGLKLEKGMTFTIEPMVNQGSSKIKHLDDEWTVVTQDGKLSAQWEHTIAVTENGYEILTLREEEKA